MRLALVLLSAVAAHSATLSGYSLVRATRKDACLNASHFTNLTCNCLRASNPDYSYECVATSVQKTNYPDPSCETFYERPMKYITTIYMNIETNATTAECRDLPAELDSFRLAVTGGVDYAVLGGVLGGLGGAILICVACCCWRNAVERRENIQRIRKSMQDHREARGMPSEPTVETSRITGDMIYYRLTP